MSKKRGKIDKAQQDRMRHERHGANYQSRSGRSNYYSASASSYHKTVANIAPTVLHSAPPALNQMHSGHQAPQGPTHGYHQTPQGPPPGYPQAHHGPTHGHHNTPQGPPPVPQHPPPPATMSHNTFTLFNQTHSAPPQMHSTQTGAPPQMSMDAHHKHLRNRFQRETPFQHQLNPPQQPQQPQTQKKAMSVDSNTSNTSGMM